jgi:hypothetical protein
MFFDILLRRSRVGFFPASATRRARRWTVSLALAVVCCFASSGGAHAHTITWSRVGTVTTLTNGQLCTNDGWNIYCDSTTPTIASGLVGIGSTAPVVSLDLSQETDALALPVGTSGMRPTGINLANGEIRYNSTLSGVETYVNGTWDTVLTAASLGSSLPAAGSTGQVQFNNAGDLGASANFFWDNTNGRVGIGTTSPAYTLDVNGSAAVGTSTGKFTLSMKDLTAGVDTFAVPSFRPTTANSVLAFDLMPNGTPTAVNGYLTWSDICDTDILNAAGSQVVDCLHLAAGTSAMYIGSLGFSKTPEPLIFVAGVWPGTQAMEVTAAGKIGIGAVAPYSNGGLLDITKNSTYTTEAAGITIQTGTNAQPELLLGTDNSHSMSYVQSASRGINFTSVPLALNPNGGNVGIGTTSPGSSLQVNGGAAVGYSASTAAPTNGLTVSGNVGVGTATVPTGVTANINGPVKVAGTGSEPCTAAQVGSMRYNPTGQYMEICTYP